MNSAKNSKKRKRKPLFYNLCHDFVKVTGALPVLLWLRPKLYRPYGTRTPRGAVMISANHNSMLDPVNLFLAFPKRRIHCLATKELYNTKVTSKFFELMHCIKVDRENFSVSAVHDIIDRLNDGRAVAIFPEGKLNYDDDTPFLAFKSGAVMMAHRAGAPILPIYIVKRTRKYQRQRIVIGKPIDLREILGERPSLDELSKASEIVREKEIELKEYFESLPIYQRMVKAGNKLKQKESKKESKTESKVQ